MMLYYLVGINIISFFIVGLDKYYAIKRKRRIPEKIIILFAVLGSFIGVILGIIVFNHKTKKDIFLYKLVLALIIELIILKLL